MSIYHCIVCDGIKDNDYLPCCVWGKGLICEDCYTALEVKFEIAHDRQPTRDELKEWASERD